MATHSGIDTSTPSADAAYDDLWLDNQRSGASFLSFVLFPLISIAAIAFAAFELVS